MKKVLLVVAVAAFTAVAADPPVDTKPVDKMRKPTGNVFTDPEKAGPDYLIQGEYSGASPGGTMGAQVIAEGDGTFNVRILAGGLPGDGWDGRTQLKGKAKLSNGKVTFEASQPKGPTINGEIGGGTFTGIDEGGRKAEFKRVVRHSPTEGAKPPPGAVVLFDGTNADAFDHGKIENGLLTVQVPGAQTSKQKFGDCTVHVEFILPFMPKARGQARGNSGVYLQGRYEVQVLDSFGLAGKNNECGGIYELSDPKVNMCYPPLQWQTYDIDYTAARYGPDRKKNSNARISVRHNGILVQENVEVGRDTRGAVVKEGPETGPLHLQNHGDPVFYRNIWVVEKK
jgi:hypothetical protein